jgi:hypothetical protein
VGQSFTILTSEKQNEMFTFVQYELDEIAFLRKFEFSNLANEAKMPLDAAFALIEEHWRASIIGRFDGDIF